MLSRRPWRVLLVFPDDRGKSKNEEIALFHLYESGWRKTYEYQSFIWGKHSNAKEKEQRGVYACCLSLECPSWSTGWKIQSQYFWRLHLHQFWGPDAANLNVCVYSSHYVEAGMRVRDERFILLNVWKDKHWSSPLQA